VNHPTGAMIIIYLTGFMGSGKSTVGRELARLLARPFIDIDSLIESREGLSVARLFAQGGEAAFREAEGRALAELSVERGPVVATGGGIVLHRKNRRLMARTGLQVWLKCPLADILRRLEIAAGEPGRRPLWTGDRQEMARLLEERTPVYAGSADLVVDATAAAAETAGAIVRWLEGRGP
jgi:shikimate kinase